MEGCERIVSRQCPVSVCESNKMRRWREGRGESG